jgi:tetratricopeptide (TPR) repeat protein/predicted transcriptional regulator
MADLVLYKFQPDAMDRKILEHLFVGEKRKKQLTEMVNNIVESLKLKSPRHYLVIGQRGMGKTHFLTLLYYHLKDKLNEEEYKVVKLAEEEYSIYRVSDFLVRILEILREEIEWNEIQKYDEDMVVEYLLEKLKEKGRGYVVIIENLDQILDKQMDKKEVKRLRAILQKEKLLWIVASSPVRFRGISEGSEPFYNFFEISYLNELNDEEIKELVEKLCELNNDNNAGAYIRKINIITKLTGGILRIVFVIYGLLREDVGGVEEILFKILDDYTPYYQDIFNTLSPQERLIFDTLISLNGIATPTEIAEKSRLERNTVSAVLKRLEKDGFVKSYKLGRITKYEVKDILFRIWREVRKTPFGKKRISMLIEFLKLWYSPEELMDNLKRAVRDGKEVNAKYYYLSLPEDIKLNVIQTLVEESVRKPDLKRFLNVILEVEDDDVKHKAKKEEYNVLYKNGKYDEILKKAENDLSLNPSDDIALLYKAIVFSDLGRFEESAKLFKKLLDIMPEESKAILLSVIGITLSKAGRFDKAIECLNNALDLIQEIGEEKSGINKCDILYDLGLVYMESNEYELAVEIYNEIIKNCPKNIDALIHLGHALKLLGKTEEEKAIHEKAVELLLSKLKYDNTGYYHERLGIIYFQMGRYSESIKMYKKALKLNPNNEKTLIYLAIIYIEYEKFDKAKKCVDEAILLNPNYEPAFELNSILHIIKVLDELQNNNYGNAEKEIREFLKWYNKIHFYTLREIVRLFIITKVIYPLAQSKNIEAIKFLINKLKENAELKELLKPVELTLDIIETKDKKLYYNVPQEIRKIVVDLVKLLTDLNELIPKEFL